MRAPVDLHERQAALHQPPCDQTTLAEAVRAISGAQLRGLAVDVERLQALTRSNERAGERVVFLHERGRMTWPCGRRQVDPIQQIPARTQARTVDTVRQRERGQL